MQTLGADCARKLHARIKDLTVAERSHELVAGKPKLLSGDRARQLSIRLDGGRRLVVEPDHDPCPCHENGSIDWSAITDILIVDIGDYHD